MVRFNFKKVAASVAALSIVACMAAVPTSASDTAVELTIGQIEVPVSQAKKNAVIDVPIKIDAPDLSGFAIYIDVEDSASGGKLKRNLEFSNAGLKMMVQAMEPDTSTASAASWASANTISLDDEDTDDNFAVIHVTLQEDLAVGEQFDIQYFPEAPTGTKCEWKDTPKTMAYECTAVNGWIKVVDDEVSTTTTPAATTTTPAATTTTPAGQGGTTTTPPAGEGESTTTTPAGGAAGDDGTTTTPAGGAASGSDTTPASGAGAGGTGTTTAAGGNTSTSSPQTGSSDVLPIAGAAAAVAVLGGVALVAKKKND